MRLNQKHCDRHPRLSQLRNYQDIRGLGVFSACQKASQASQLSYTIQYNISKINFALEWFKHLMIKKHWTMKNRPKKKPPKHKTHKIASHSITVHRNTLQNPQNIKAK